MDASLYNAGESLGMSVDGGDSNALVLPSKKRKTKGEKLQGAAMLQASKGKKLSKSQKRKLKKLEEEKEKEKLLSKSVEILEKCKINEGVYKLLSSTRNLGQAETSKEKRRRMMQFSQAGLESPYTDMPKRRKLSDHYSSATEPNDESQVPQVSEDDSDVMLNSFVQKELPASSLQLCRDGSEGNLISTAKSLSEEVSVEQQHEQPIEVNGAASSCVSSPRKNKSVMELIIPRLKEKQKLILPEGTSDVMKDTSGSQGALNPPTVVHVSRPEEVQSKRKDLPIIMMEQEIMEAINENISVILCGETGCGKTTQVPQFLYEAGYGSKLSDTHSGVIGVTQPRRVAVLATAKRVAYELGLQLGKGVGFQVRYDKMIGQNSAIKFMTDGILLREVQSDFLLKRYSVIILDEAHERSLNTDILVGMLSRVVRQRQAIYEEQQKEVLSGAIVNPETRIFPLKLILMSATLRVEDFTLGGRIFRNPPPVIEVPTRQYPVTIHFSKRTDIDYLGQAFRKTLSIHKNLPPGGILVFVTGQREVESLCSKLRKASKDLVKKSSEAFGNDVTLDTSLSEVDGYDMKEINDAVDVTEESTEHQTSRYNTRDEAYERAVDEDSDFSYHSESESDLEFESVDTSVLSKCSETEDDISQNVTLDSLKAAFSALAGKDASKPESEEKKENQASIDGCVNESEPSMKEKGEKSEKVVGPMCVLPLYAMLPAAAQLRVFGDAKDGERLVVVATNVAETSLTIPGIRYVVDTGKEKVKKYNLSNGVESYEVQWISKASAAQRAGRAGRTGPGHCYRIYSSAAFSNIFSDFSCAEILKVPVEGVVLLMKSMGISKVANFPFPTPPDVNSLVEAERCLKALEALDHEGRLTSLGKTMAQYPMNPRHSRMLLTAIHFMKKEKRYVRPNLVLAYAVAAAATLSFSNPFLLQFEGCVGSSDSHEQDEKSGSFEDRKSLDKQQKSVRKKLKEAVRVSRAKFSNIKSDALTTAYALHCYELCENQSEFCTDNALHQKTMEEMSKLRKQLLQLVFKSSFSGLQEEYVWSEGTLDDVEHAWSIPSEKNPLSQIEENLLLGSICAGWVDRVAKRVTKSSHFSEGDQTINSLSYQACMVEKKVCLHRWSSVSKSAPEFLVYSELLDTTRAYIHGASTVQPEWLVKYGGSSCTFSAPLTDPKPGYDNATDEVYVHVIPYFGPHSWELPYHKMPISDVMQRVTVFAYALLDGQVLPCLKSVRKFMAAQPSTMLKAEALGQKRVGDLLSKLKSRSRIIDNCAKLQDAWRENPKELYEEILCWFQVGFHGCFEELWTRMHHEAFLSPRDRFPSKKKKRRALVG